MELRQLTYFRAIVEHGSINAAARALHMSQPPLSYAISQLEEELGVKLFTRSAKGIELTQAGSVFYTHANDILNRTASIMREVSMTGQKQILRIGITPTVVPVVSKYLAQLAKEDDSIQLELYEGNTYHLKELLDDGTLDAAFIRTPVNLQGCKFLKILEEPMAAVSLKRQRKDEISLQDLQKERLILYRRYEPLIQETFKKLGLEMNLVCECDDARTAISLAQEGLGTAVIPMTIAQTQKLSAIEIQAKELTTSVILTWYTASPSLHALTKLLKK